MAKNGHNGTQERPANQFCVKLNADPAALVNPGALKEPPGVVRTSIANLASQSKGSSHMPDNGQSLNVTTANQNSITASMRTPPPPHVLSRANQRWQLLVPAATECVTAFERTGPRALVSCWLLQVLKCKA